tara:strand:+ start:1951 stop:2568 length:618 start_codon:yes stop_codon:yes gene_type:complete
MGRNKENFNPVGELEVWKVYEDGRDPELHFSENNVITSGLGVGFASLYAGSGSDSIVDYQILNFQLGVGGDSDNYGTSTSHLAQPLSATQYNSDGSQMHIDDTHKLLVSSNVVTTETVKLARIPYSNIHKSSPTSIRYTLVVDRHSCNLVTNDSGEKLYLDEVGLFMRNPLDLSPPTSILVAYRPFTGIFKTSAFALVFKWTLKF